LELHRRRALLADVASDEGHACHNTVGTTRRAAGDGGPDEAAVLAAVAAFVPLHRPASCNRGDPLAHRRSVARISAQRGDAATDHLVGGPAVEALGAAAPVGDDAVDVGGGDAVGEVLDQLGAFP